MSAEAWEHIESTIAAILIAAMTVGVIVLGIVKIDRFGAAVKILWSGKSVEEDRVEKFQEDLELTNTTMELLGQTVAHNSGLIRDLQVQLNEKTVQIEDLQSQLNEKTEENNELRTQILMLEKKVEELSKEAKENASLRAEVHALKKEIGVLRSVLAANELLTADLERRIADVKNQS
jgi:predicted RNase H-like nuclease (RuvC/YqgF family)